MDVEVLRTFVAVAEAGQFQAAADELGISQQAASRRIAAFGLSTAGARAPHDTWVPGWVDR